MTKDCENCSVSFQAVKPSRRFCSVRCQAFWRERRLSELHNGKRPNRRTVKDSAVKTALQLCLEGKSTAEAAAEAGISTATFAKRRKEVGFVGKGTRLSKATIKIPEEPFVLGYIAGIIDGEGTISHIVCLNPPACSTAGITVAGSESSQQFRHVLGFPVEIQSHVIVLQLRGEVAGKVVAAPVTVAQKPKCTSCGRVNKATSRHCAGCGTALVLI